MTGPRVGYGLYRDLRIRYEELWQKVSIALISANGIGLASSIAFVGAGWIALTTSQPNNSEIGITGGYWFLMDAVGRAGHYPMYSFFIGFIAASFCLIGRMYFFFVASEYIRSRREGIIRHRRFRLAVLRCASHAHDVIILVSALCFFLGAIPTVQTILEMSSFAKRISAGHASTKQ
jgi:hypothetical protein